MSKSVASYQVRINLSEREDQTVEAYLAAEGAPKRVDPTIDEIERLIADTLYERLAYFTSDVIRVTAERLDR